MRIRIGHSFDLKDLGDILNARSKERALSLSAAFSTIQNESKVFDSFYD